MKTIASQADSAKFETLWPAEVLYWSESAPGAEEASSVPSM